MEMGLDSQKMTRLQSILRKEVRQELPGSVLFDLPTPAALVEYLSTQSHHDVLPRRNPRAALDLETGDTSFLLCRCRFPVRVADHSGCRAALVHRGTSASLVPLSRWYVGVDSNPTNAIYGAFLDDLETFDRNLFFLSKMEALEMDPQQRLLLGAAHDALQEQRTPDGRDKHRIGVAVLRALVLAMRRVRT